MQRAGEARPQRSEAGVSEEHQIGTAAEEAAKLLGAFAAHAAEVAAGVGRGLDENLATGAPECAYCPICRAVHVVREASPELRLHLASAAASLMQAAASVLDAVAASGHEAATARSDTVETIDLDETGWEGDA